MSLDTILLVQLILVIIPLSSFLLSFRIYFFNSNTQLFIRLFFFYNLAILIEIILWCLAIFGMIDHHVYQNYHLFGLLCNFLFLSLFIINNISNRYVKSGAYIITMLFFFITMGSWIQEFKYYTGKSFVFPHSCLLLLSVAYYVQFLDKNFSVDVIFDAPFWIITGVFCCSVLMIPIMTIRELLKQSLSPSTYYAFAIIGFLAYTIMHLFFIKGFLCSIQKQTSSPLL